MFSVLKLARAERGRTPSKSFFADEVSSLTFNTFSCEPRELDVLCLNLCADLGKRLFSIGIEGGACDDDESIKAIE